MDHDSNHRRRTLPADVPNSAGHEQLTTSHCWRSSEDDQMSWDDLHSVVYRTTTAKTLTTSTTAKTPSYHDHCTTMMPAMHELMITATHRTCRSKSFIPFLQWRPANLGQLILGRTLVETLIEHLSSLFWLHHHENSFPYGLTLYWFSQSPFWISTFVDIYLLLLAGVSEANVYSSNLCKSECESEIMNRSLLT